MTAPSPRPPALLEAHPELRAVMERSETFRRVAERARITIDGRTSYLVRGDTLGTLEDLFVDTICRGSSPDAPDPPSRALFLELAPELEEAVRRRVRRDP